MYKYSFRVYTSHIRKWLRYSHSSPQLYVQNWSVISFVPSQICILDRLGRQGLYWSCRNGWKQQSTHHHYKVRVAQRYHNWLHQWQTILVWRSSQLHWVGASESSRSIVTCTDRSLVNPFCCCCCCCQILRLGRSAQTHSVWRGFAAPVCPNCVWGQCLLDWLEHPHSGDGKQIWWLWSSSPG